MAFFEKEEATELRELFAGMDAVDETRAASAMAKASTLLRKRDFSFRHIVQEIDARGLLLPAKVGAAIQLMDSTTLAEAKGAFGGVRRLMKNCGLTFAGIMVAHDRQPVKEEDLEEAKLAFKIEAERARELEAEVQRLRATVAATAAAAAAAAGVSPPSGTAGAPPPGTAGQAPPVPAPKKSSSPLGNIVVVATLLLGVVLAASIASTFSDMFKSANLSITPLIAAPAAPVGATVAPREAVDRLAPPRAGWNCWRNRGTQGPCF
jgi:hypothetical protein